MAAGLCKRAIARAAQILGGRERLAALLKADVEQLNRWSQLETPPQHLLQCAASVLRYEIAKKHSPRVGSNPRSRPSKKR